MNELYKRLRQHGFEFGYAQKDGMFIRGWVLSFIQFKIDNQEERDHLVYLTAQLKDEDFPKLFGKYLIENREEGEKV